ncbi:hypothetical protein [Psychroflexus planctonicus]|uniref:Uncharacterized protein n=1 Tax=Psychroflexus planctonicus TaxID=1526575 RepID=A0ABQ1SEY0_9FLAO|nr:hypothetical protein [Psychroflexus planctonicus]GGE25110.1 hypothetical protein GCM10010832_02340 [Psychroflexus planctonicus]
MSKFLKIFKIVVGVLGAILFFRILNTGDDALEADTALQSSVISPLMYVAYAILLLCVVSVLGFVIKGLFSGNVKNTLIGLGSFLVILVVSFLVSEGQETALRDGEVLSEYGSRWVSAGLTMFYILVGLAIAAIVASNVKSLMAKS